MITSLSSNEFVNDILRQPEALENTLLGFEKPEFERIHFFEERLASGMLKRVVLTGMGSSYHALHPIFLTLTDRGIHSQMIETSELIHFAPKLLSSDTLVIVVSQSGQSAEILQLLTLTGDRIPMIAVTNTHESLLAKRADTIILTRAGTEHSVSCKTYVTALAALTVLGELLTNRDPRKIIADLHSTAAAMAQYLVHWDDYVEAAIHEMEGIRYVTYVGRGPSLAAAGTGGLITKEAAHFPAEGMSSAAFRHGPLEMISSEIFVLVYEGIGKSRRLNTKLADDIRNVGGRAELVIVNDEASIYNLPATCNLCLPLLEILPAQLISVALAIRNNHTPGQFQLASKTTIVE